MPVTLRALAPLRGDYGRVAQGQVFSTSEDTAEFLMARGLVERVRERPIQTVRSAPTATARAAGR